MLYILCSRKVCTSICLIFNGWMNDVCYSDWLCKFEWICWVEFLVSVWLDFPYKSNDCWLLLWLCYNILTHIVYLCLKFTPNVCLFRLLNISFSFKCINTLFSVWLLFLGRRVVGGGRVVWKYYEGCVIRGSVNSL